MKKENFNIILNSLSEFKYTSMHYVDFEDLENFSIVINEDDLILLHGESLEGIEKFHYASNSIDSLLKGIKESNLLGIITFIPPQWVKQFEEKGYHVCAIFRDYWNQDIHKYVVECEDIELLQFEDCAEAATVTQKCIGQSREFFGETEEWMKEWIDNKKSSNVNNQDNAVILHREEGKIVGVLCTSIYGHNSEKGAIVWIRMLAVDPEYQRRGIAKKLMYQALSYGVSHNAKRGFLMVDECNDHAIHLYQKLGFMPKKDEMQIDILID